MTGVAVSVTTFVVAVAEFAVAGTASLSMPSSAPVFELVHT